MKHKITKKETLAKHAHTHHVLICFRNISISGTKKCFPGSFLLLSAPSTLKKITQSCRLLDNLLEVKQTQSLQKGIILIKNIKNFTRPPSRSTPGRGSSFGWRCSSPRSGSNAPNPLGRGIPLCPHSSHSIHLLYWLDQGKLRRTLEDNRSGGLKLRKRIMKRKEQDRETNNNLQMSVCFCSS